MHQQAWASLAHRTMLESSPCSQTQTNFPCWRWFPVHQPPPHFSHRDKHIINSLFPTLDSKACGWGVRMEEVVNVFSVFLVSLVALVWLLRPSPLRACASCSLSAYCECMYDGVVECTCSPMSPYKLFPIPNSNRPGFQSCPPCYQPLTPDTLIHDLLTNP